MTPVAVTIADHIASQNLVAGILAALFAASGPAADSGSRRHCSVGRSGRRRASSRAACCAAARRDAPTAGIRSSPVCTACSARPTDGSRSSASWAACARRSSSSSDGRTSTSGSPSSSTGRPTRRQLFPLLDEAFAAASTAEWCERLDAAGVRNAPVRDHAEVIADPNVWANGYLATVDGVDVVAAPVSFSDTPAAALGGDSRSWDSTPKRCCSSSATRGTTSVASKRRASI